jgi:hypothetical protein
MFIPLDKSKTAQSVVYGWPRHLASSSVRHTNSSVPILGIQSEG